MKKFYLRIQHFGEGGGDGAGAGAGTGTVSTAGNEEGAAGGLAENNQAVAKPNGRKGNPLEDVVYGKQQSDDNSITAEQPAEQSKSVPTTEDKKSDFEKLIKGDYKEEFDARVQQIINKRFGEAKAMQSQIDSTKPIMQILSDKYGVDVKDTQALAKALEADASFFEAEASKRGLSVEQYKNFRKLETENARLKEANEEAERVKQGEQIYAKWMNEADQFKQETGITIDFEQEAQNPDFLAVLRANGTVGAAYQAVHYHDMLGGGMAATAKAVSEQLAKNVASRNMRPSENGVSSQAAVTVKKDVSKLTKEDRAEICRRVARGERVSF